MTQAKHIPYKITMDGLWADGRLLPNPHTSTAWERMLGEQPRIAVANAAAPDWRKVVTFDAHGIYLLCEGDPFTVRSVVFVWMPPEVPYPPQTRFTGGVVLNGKVMGANTNLTPADFESGSIHLRRLVGHTYGAGFAEFHISVKVAKVADGDRKASRLLAPAYLEFSYSAGCMPDSLIAGRMRQN